jgi:tRNA A-37 threonylcarbamoyl transferase component Bud32
MSKAMPETVQVQAGGVRWQVVPLCREQLLGPDGLRLEEWLRAGQAQVVKHGPHRTVYKVTLPGLCFYLKHYPVTGVRAWLRQLVRPSKARTEYRKALAAAARGVPTVVPLAVGERLCGLKPTDSFLITRSLDDTEPLNVFIETTFPRLEPARRARVRQRLAVELGKLMARVHDAGLDHQDLHAGNLLIRLGPEDMPQLYVIDLHAVHLGRPLSWRARRDNLVILNRWFVLRAGRADRLRFWQAYCSERGARSAECSAQARDLERRTWESNWHFWRNRDRRCLRTNRYYRRLRGGAVTGHAVADLDSAALSALLAEPDEPFRRPGVVLLKDSRSSTVAEFDMSVAGVIRRVIYKRFRVTAWSDPWAALVRRTAALRSWVNGHGLRDRGLPTARPLAVFHRRRHGLAYEGYLLTEKIPDAVDLRDYVDGLSRLPSWEGRLVVRRLIDQVAGLVRDLHRRRLSHRDLKAANVLVSPGGDGQGPCWSRGLWLIDLVGVASWHRLARARRVQNLARLHASFCQDPAVSRTDKLRFLRTYLQLHLRGRAGWKRWWHEVETATRAKVVRNLRKGRVLA